MIQWTGLRRRPASLPALIWLAVWGFLGFFVSYATVVPIAVAEGLGTVTGGMLLTTMMVCVLAVQPGAPGLRRLLGPRLTLGGALALMAAGHAFAIPVATPELALAVTGVAVGLGFGVTVVVATAAVPLVSSPERAGRSLGLFGASTTAAGAVGSPAGLWLVDTVDLDLFRAVVAGCVLLGLLVILRVPLRAEESRRVKEASPLRVEALQRRLLPRLGTWFSALGPVLAPLLVTMTAFGLVVAFGAGGGVPAALAVLITQGCSVLSRLGAGALADRHDPFQLFTAGILLTAAGLSTAALADGPVSTALLLAVTGLGVGTVQSASLVLAFARAPHHGQASVSWNMGFDTGLGAAGLVGGIGFSMLGPVGTFIAVAVVLVLSGIPLWRRPTRPEETAGTAGRVR